VLRVDRSGRHSCCRYPAGRRPSTSLCAKLAAHLPDRAVGDVLSAYLPLTGGASHPTVRRHTLVVTHWLEADAEPIETLPSPVPAVMTVALDTGYVRAISATGGRQLEILIGNIARGNRRLNTFTAVAAAGASWQDHMSIRLQATGPASQT
jgi:hypothetical protein